MKRVVIFFAMLTLLFACMLIYANARMNLMMVGGNVATSTTTTVGDCPSGTYTFYWDGDHSTNENLACTANGASTDAYDAGSDYISDSIDSDGDQEFYATANDQYIRWTSVSYIDDEVGTVWFSVYSASALTTQMNLLESVTDATDGLKVQLKTNSRIMGVHEGNGNSQTIDHEDAVVDTSTPAWSRCAYTWQTAADAGGVHCVACDGSGWECVTEDIDAWDDQPQDMTIGDYYGGGSDGGAFAVDEVYVTQSYQSSDPCTGCKGQ